MTTPIPYDPELAPLVVRANELAETFAIGTAHEYERAVGVLRTVQTMRDTIRAFFKPMKDDAYKAHKTIVARETEHLSPLERAERRIKGAMIAFTAEQARLAAIERERLLAEARAREEERRLQVAIALEHEADVSGDESMRAVADDLLDAPMDLPVIATEPETPVVNGISYQSRWSADVYDLAALATAVVNGTVPLAAIQPNETWLNAEARQARGSVTYPGVRFVETKVVVARK